MADAGPVAVTNTSPVINLASIDHLWLLEASFSRVLVPLPVWEELDVDPNRTEATALLGLSNTQLRPSPPVPTDAVRLHRGERAAVALAHATPGAWVLLDDLRARRVARKLGLNVRGTLGILVEAKRSRNVALVRPLLSALAESGCWLSSELIEEALKAAGEA